MNIIDALLMTDTEELGKGLKKEFEIDRLSKILKLPFIVECYPLTPEQTQHISEISAKTYELKLNAIVEACKIEGKKINNAALMEKFNCLTAKELVEKLFLIGEISELYSCISELSGYGRDSVKEVKKL